MDYRLEVDFNVPRGRQFTALKVDDIVTLFEPDEDEEITCKARISRVYMSEFVENAVILHFELLTDPVRTQGSQVPGAKRTGQ